MAIRRIVIMGAAGRDFHVFNVCYRQRPETHVVAFTATQIPGIAGRRYPVELAGPGYPEGIPIVPEADLESLVRDEAIDEVVFAYSDVTHETVMHAASRALAAGASFVLPGPRATMLESRRPVIAVCAVRTGSGKSQTTRYLAGQIKAAGLMPVVVRHPMPYGDLAAQAVQRFATYADLERHQTTIEEREEYEPHLEAGTVVYAGVDYGAILAAAEGEADVILWDGGNNDFSFYRPNLNVVVADPLRPADGMRHHPGETNLRMADVIIVNKVDSATPDALATVRADIAAANPTAAVVLARSSLRLDGGEIVGRSVVVVEDGPTLTHGGMAFGAGVVAAGRFGATIVDPRPYAVGSIAEVLARYPALDRLVPAMGYGPEQVADLRATLEATPADVVLSATPIDLATVLHLERPVIRVRYDLEQLDGPPLAELIRPTLELARRPVGMEV